MKKMKWLLMLLMALPLNVAAQESDFGIWYSAGAEKKVNQKLSLGVEGEFRTRNDSKTADRWSGGLSAEYKLLRGLKLSAGYNLLYDNNQEKITYNTDGSLNNWRPSYWGLRHRFNVALTGALDLGNFSFSLRERWQYTWRPEKDTKRYDFDNDWWEYTTVRSKSRHLLRSRLQVEYNIPHCKVDPYASVELFNAMKLQKTRFTLGADWKYQKKHVVGLFYRYQSVNSNDDDEPDRHILGLSYKFKF